MIDAGQLYAVARNKLDDTPEPSTPARARAALRSQVNKLETAA